MLASCSSGGNSGSSTVSPAGTATSASPGAAATSQATGTSSAAAPGAAATPQATGTASSGNIPATGNSGCPLQVEQGAKITFSGWGDETEQKVYRDSIARFNKVCPGVTVNYNPVPSDFQTKMKAQMAGGTALLTVFILQFQAM